MKFFIIIILISSCLTARSAYPGDVQGTLVPFARLYYPYSIHRILQPRNADPNISSSALGTRVEDGEKSDLSISLPRYLYSMRVDTLHACGHDLYSLPLSISERSPNYKFELSSRDIFAECLLSELDSGT